MTDFIDFVTLEGAKLNAHASGKMLAERVIYSFYAAHGLRATAR